MTPVWLLVVTGIMSALAGAVGAYVALRKDRRDERTAEAEAADVTIRMLKEQNTMLREQGEKRESEWAKRESDWKRERTSLEARIEAVERDYRTLVLTVTTMGLCINAKECNDYNPGDRRLKPNTK